MTLEIYTLLWLLGIFLAYCIGEARGYTRGVKDETRRLVEWPSTSGPVLHVEDKRSEVVIRSPDGSFIRTSIDSFGNETPSPSTL